MIKYQLIEQKPTSKEFLELRKVVKWQVPFEADCEKGLNNSIYTVIIQYDGKCVATGRILGDNSLVFLIQDIMVHPNHQKKGLGKKIMKALMNYVEQHASEGAFIGLFAATGVESWYENYGFVKRPNEFLGAGMTFIHHKLS